VPGERDEGQGGVLAGLRGGVFAVAQDGEPPPESDGSEAVAQDGLRVAGSSGVEPGPRCSGPFAGAGSDAGPQVPFGR